MKTEYLVFDNSREGQIIEEVCKVFPYICISVFTKAFIIKPVDLGDLATLMISSQNSDSFLIADFKCDEQSYCFDRIIASVHIVAHEKIISIGRSSSNLKQLHQVVELPMHISAHSYRTPHWLDICFILQNFFSL